MNVYYVAPIAKKNIVLYQELIRGDCKNLYAKYAIKKSYLHIVVMK
jgi:hypothetical protein